MEVPLAAKAALILFLLGFSGFFSGSETALFSLSRIQRERLKKTHPKSSLIEALLSQPRRLIVTILMGNDLVNIAAAAVAADIFITVWQEYGKWAAMAVMTPVTLIFAEVIPKTLCVAYNERMAPIVSTPIDLFSRLIGPVRWVFYRVSGLILQPFATIRHETGTTIMEEEFKDMVDLSHADGELEILERDLIHNVLEFSDTFINEVMTPVERIFALPEDMEAAKVIRFVKENYHSRIPVYAGDINSIVGILYAKDLFKLDSPKLERREKILPRIYRKPFFIKECRKVDELFYILKQRRIHIAICLNENGGVSGLVTMEDLLEELFGEIYDEHDEHDEDEK